MTALAASGASSCRGGGRRSRLPASCRRDVTSSGSTRPEARRTFKITATPRSTIPNRMTALPSESEISSCFSNDENRRMWQTSKICHTRRILPSREALGRLHDCLVTLHVRIGVACERSENGHEHQREENRSLHLCHLPSLAPYDDGGVPSGCGDAR